MSAEEQVTLPIVCAVEGCGQPPAKSGNRMMSKCLGHLMSGGESLATSAAKKAARRRR